MDAVALWSLVGAVWGFASPLIGGVLGGLVGGFLAHRHAIQRYWWEKKAEAYVSILGALSEMVGYIEARLEEAGHEKQYTNDWLTMLHGRWKGADREIAKAVRTGAFLISVDAHAALDRRVKKNAEVEQTAMAGDAYPLIDADLANSQICIDEVRSAARADLQGGLKWRALWSSNL